MSGIDDYMLPCLNKKLLGFECLGCGMQRSASLVLKGEFTEAFYMYPAIYTLILFVIIAINHFNNFKYASKVITVLVILNVIIIVGNFAIKLTH